MDGLKGSLNPNDIKLKRNQILILRNPQNPRQKRLSKRLASPEVNPPPLIMIAHSKIAKKIQNDSELMNSKYE